MSFVHLDKSKHLIISRKGAKALHEQKKAHKFSSEKAREAAKKRWQKSK